MKSCGGHFVIQHSIGDTSATDRHQPSGDASPLGEAGATRLASVGTDQLQTTVEAESIGTHQAESVATPGTQASDGGDFTEDTPTADELAEFEDQQNTSISPPATESSHQLQTATASSTCQLQMTFSAESMR